MVKHSKITAGDFSPVPFRTFVGGAAKVEIPNDLLRVAMHTLATREARTTFFDAGMFGEGAWDMLLALYIAYGRGYAMKVSDACNEARVPPTTALRWLDYLVETGLVTRKKNIADARSQLVEITSEAALQMNQYLQRAAAILARR